MCGVICGETRHVCSDEIQKALMAIGHRGPDGSAIYRKDDVFLGHTRLSIVDINGGMQPLFNEDKSIIAVVNGEFYDYEELKVSLVKKGHHFATQSDSEMLIHLYEEYGTDCLQYLHGEFAFVLFDRRFNRWFCARDRAGIRPLQFYWKNGDFFVASEVKSILMFKNVETSFNRENFWFSQHMQYLPLDGTLFNHIHMIKPAHFLIVENGGIPQQHQYWDIKSIESSPINFEEAVEKSRFLIEKSIEKRIPHEVPWTTHLSGGIDSSIVSALAQPYQKGKKTCFTVQFTDDSFYDESALAQETANYIGAELIKVPVSFEDIIKALPDAVFHAEGLSINGHLGAKYILNKEIRAHGVKVALSGEGADEIFMGYSHLKQDFLSAHGLNQSEKNYLTGIQLPDGDTLNLSEFSEKIGFVPTWLAAKSSMGFKFSQLWHRNFHFKKNPYEMILPDFQGYSSELKASSGSWMKYCLNGYILKVLDDAQAMAHSVEGRLPFLDTDLMEFMYSLHDNLYFKNNIEKALLRESFKDDVPHNVIAKTKQSFMSPPIHRFLHNACLKRHMEEYIYDNTHFIDLQLFDHNKLCAFFAKAQINNSPSLEPILMTLLSVGMLTKQFNLQ